MEVYSMTGRELHEFFKEHLVPSKLYKINGHHNHRICMEKDDSGWDVYFRDRKDKVGLIHFANEADACNGMKNEIRKLMQCMYGVSWAV